MSQSFVSFSIAETQSYAENSHLKHIDERLHQLQLDALGENLLGEIEPKLSPETASFLGDGSLPLDSLVDMHFADLDRILSPTIHDKQSHLEHSFVENKAYSADTNTEMHPKNISSFRVTDPSMSILSNDVSYNYPWTQTNIQKDTKTKQKVNFSDHVSIDSPQQSDNQYRVLTGIPGQNTSKSIYF